MPRPISRVFAVIYFVLHYIAATLSILFNFRVTSWIKLCALNMH